jgi:short subunit dehydrogenase-like uncharacterized protein
MAERDLDVVVLGATGVTGRRVAAHLAARAGTLGTRWAAAARDVGRARDVLAGIGVEAPELIAADVADPASLRALAARASVVLDLVGPYTLYGRPVIDACVAEGAHYVDLTGEIPFVRSIIDALHERAQAAGVKVVEVCGFESLPVDLAILLARDAARERHGEELAAVDAEVSFVPPPRRPRGGDMISGGTVQSLLAVAEGEDSELIADPAALITDPVRAAAVRAASPIDLAPRRGRLGGVVAPMAPAPFINPAVVQRSAALGGGPDGAPAPPFRYREGVTIPGAAATLPLSWGAAASISATQAALRGLARAPASVRRPVVRALARVAPSSGFGPAPDRLEGWRWRMLVLATTPSGRHVRVDVDAEGHPGYLATARMLAEAGALLAQDRATPALAGCLTPALALGSTGIERFAEAHVRFSVSPDGN